MRVPLPICLVLMVTSCNDKLDLAYVRSNVWSYDGGFKVGKGDILVFELKERIFELRSDTIYYEGKPRAIIQGVNKEEFSMTIKSIDGNKTGAYRNIEESLESHSHKN